MTLNEKIREGFNMLSGSVQNGTSGKYFFLFVAVVLAVVVVLEVINIVR